MKLFGKEGRMDGWSSTRMAGLGWGRQTWRIAGVQLSRGNGLTIDDEEMDGDYEEERREGRKKEKRKKDKDETVAKHRVFAAGLLACSTVYCSYYYC